MRWRNLAKIEFLSSQQATIASSGLRSITQKKKRPPLSCTNSAPRNEINGGEVKATTTSTPGMTTRRSEEIVRKLAKVSARRHLVCFPRDSEGTRIIFIPFQDSRARKRTEGSS